MAKIKKLLLISLGIRLLLIFISGYHPDILNHVDWGIRLWKYGSKDFYEQIFWGVSWPNQPLGTMYLFGLIAKVYQGIFGFLWFLNQKIALFPSFIFPFLEAKLHIILLKIPFILTDLGLGGLLYQITTALTKRKKAGILAASLFLFNPVLIYNSAVWGQTDSLLNLLFLFGFWQLYQKKYFLGWLGVVACLYFKLSLIIWLPIIGLIVWLHRKEWQKIFKNFALVTGIFIALSLPFVHHGNVFTWLWYLYTNRVLPRQGNMLSGNAFNLWNLLYGLDLALSPDLLLFGLRAKIWGYLLTLLSLSLVICFFIKKIIRKKKVVVFDYFWLFLFFSFASFLFLTNMHERYLYPIFAPLAILAASKKISPKTYWLLASIHFLNLYTLWWYPKINLLQAFLEAQDFLLPRFFSLVLLGVFLKLLVAYNKNNGQIAKKGK